MTKNRKLPIAMAAVLSLIAGGLYANPGFNTSSPQGDVTQGKFESNADYFMSVRNYATMDFDKWWSVIAYKHHSGVGENDKIYVSGDLAQIGFAARFGGLYTALSYRGNGFFELGKWSGSNSSVFSYTEQTIDGKTWKFFNSAPELDYRSGGGPNLRNEAAVLFGFANMGVRLYYMTNYQSNSVADYAIENAGDRGYYKNWQEEYGHINPGITWGMTRALIPGWGIKPQVNIDLDFLREYQMREWLTDNKDPSSASNGMEILVAKNRFIPGVDIGLGAVTLATVNNFSLDIDLDYGIKLHLYKNDFSYKDDTGKNQTKTLTGSQTTGPGSVADIFGIQHSLTPAISAGWSGSRLRLACRLGVPMTVHKTNETNKTSKPGSTDGSLVKNGYDDTTIIYTLKPALDLAMQWEIFPSRLFLNAGGKLTIFEASYKTLDRELYANDVVNEADAYKKIDNEFVPAVTDLYLGVTFNLTPNMELQAALGIDSGNNINVFSSSINDARGGFLNFGNILVTLKF